MLTARQSLGGSTQRSATYVGPEVVLSAANATPFLCFGDIVQLWCEQVHTDRGLHVSARGGFMGADGFVEEQCDVCITYNRGAASDVSDNLFRVTPKLQAQCQKKLTEQLQKSVHISNNTKEEEFSIDFDELAIIERLRHDTRVEAELNAAETERSLGHIVNYGQTIQLTHIKSGKVLTIRSKEVADVDNKCQRVCLSVTGGPEAWWMVEPRYRAMGVGEPVRYGDSLSISSGKVAGFLLHVANEATQDVALEHSAHGREPSVYYEVNCYNIDVKTTWKFRSYTPYARDDKAMVKGGDVIQLLHVQTKLLLAHADAPADVDAGSVYMKAKDDVISANTLWRIEHEDAADGREHYFGGSVRLRHLVTDQYLALRHELSMVPASDERADMQTVVTLVGQGMHREGKIVGELSVYLMGRKAEKNLGVQVAQRCSGTATGVVCDILQLQDAFRIVKVKNEVMRNYYSLLSIRTALNRFMYVHGDSIAVPKLPCEKSEKSRFSYSLAARILMDIVKLTAGNMYNEGVKTKKKLVRELGLLDIFCDTTMLMHKKVKSQGTSMDESIIISSSPRAAKNDANGHTSFRAPQDGGLNTSRILSATPGRDPERVDQHQAFKVYSAAHRALQASIEESEDNIDELAEFVPILLQQMSGAARLVFDARKTFLSMVACDAPFKETIPLLVLEHFLCGIDTDTASREVYVQLLCQLITNEGRAIKRNQKILIERWLLIRRRASLLFHTITPESGIIKIRINPEGPSTANQHKSEAQSGGSKGGGGDKGHARVIDLEALTNSQKDRPVYNLYLAQLELLHRLCMGFNVQARTLIAGPRNCISYDALLQGISNERLPPKLCSVFARLMRTLYVERPRVDHVLRLRTSFFLDEIKDDHAPSLPAPLQNIDAGGDFQKTNLDLKELSGAGSLGSRVDAAKGGNVESHEALKKAVLLYFKNHQTFTIPEAEPGESELTLAMMELLDELTSLGHFNDENTLREDIVPSVLNVLEYQTDSIKVPVDPRCEHTDRILDRHMLCPLTLPMMRAKLSGCQVLLTICDFRLTLRLRRMLALVYEVILKENSPACRRGNSMLFSHSHSFTAAMHQKSFAHLRTRPEDKHEHEQGHATPQGVAEVEVVKGLVGVLKREGAIERMKRIVKSVALVSNTDSTRIPRILLDLTRSQMEEVAQAAFTLLLRERAPKMELYLHLYDTQIVDRTRRSARDARKIEAMLEQLRRLINRCKITLTSSIDPDRLMAQHKEQLLVLLKEATHLCSPDLVATGAFSRDKFGLAELAERSFVNKERMRRLHAHEFVLELLCACMTPFGDPNGTFIGAQISLQALQGASAQPMSSAEQAGPQGTQGAGVASATHFREMDPEDMRWLVAECLPACFVFLEHFCRGLPRNQIQVARHVSLITAFLRSGVSCVPQALTGIYEGNRALCEEMDRSVIDDTIDYLAYGPLGNCSRGKHRQSNQLQREKLGGLDKVKEGGGMGGAGGGVGESKSRGSAKEAVTVTARPVFDVSCLRFLEVAFNIEGQMVRGNQSYVLQRLIMNGPANIVCSPEERTRYKINLELAQRAGKEPPGTSGMHTADGNLKELAIQLFRGTEGELVREAARRARAGVEDPMQDVLEYNIALLRLLRILSLDVGPGDQKLLRSLFEPERMVQDVRGSVCLRRAKAQTIDLFCALYLQQGLRSQSSTLDAAHAALWSLLEYLDEQLQLADARVLAAAVERSHGGDTLALPTLRGERAVAVEEARKRANAELELLLADHWAPLLDSVLSNTTLLEGMSVGNRKTLERVLKRVVELLEAVDNLAAPPLLSPTASARSFDVASDNGSEQPAKETFVTLRMLYTKLSAMKLAPISVPYAAAVTRDLHELELEVLDRESRKRSKMPCYTFVRPQESTESLVMTRKLQCFAQAFLEVTDPVAKGRRDSAADDTNSRYSDDEAQDEAHEALHVGVREEVEVAEEEEEEEEEDSDDDGDYPLPAMREELEGLSAVFYDICVVGPSSSVNVYARSVMSPIEHLLQMLVKPEHMRKGCRDPTEWECESMLLLSVLRGLVNKWAESDSDAAPPDWLLSIPKLIVDLVHAQTSDRVTLMALELAIVTLGRVAPPTPVQQAFYEVLKTDDRKTSAFMGELLLRMQRGEEEVMAVNRLFLKLCSAMLSKHQRSIKETLTLVDGYETMLRGQSRDLHLQMVRAKRQEVRPASHVEAIFRFLQLLCEGHNLRMQNYLRQQTNGIRSVDLVSATANYVFHCTPHICPLTMSSPIRALDCLAEFVQHPCRPNQRVLADTALVASCHSLLNMSSESSLGTTTLREKFMDMECELTAAHIAHKEAEIQLVENVFCAANDGFDHKVNLLKFSTITCLLSLLECADEAYIPERMLQALGHELLLKNMNKLLMKYNPKLVGELLKSGDIDVAAFEPSKRPDHGTDKAGMLDLISEELKINLELDQKKQEQAREVAQKFYITYITLASFDTSGRFKEGLVREKIWDIDELRKAVGVIEISRSGVLERAYFIIPSICSYLTETSKRSLLVNVNRANLQTMLAGFSEAFDSLYEEMKYQKKLQDKAVLNFFRTTVDWREKVFFGNAIVINILILLFYNYECNQTFLCGDHEELKVYRIRPGWRELVVVLTCIQCLFAITRMWWYVVERGIPITNAIIVENSKHPRTNSMWSMLVWLPEELADPVSRHIPRLNEQDSLGMAKWRLHFVRLVHMCTVVKFWAITAQAVMNVLAILIDHEGSKLLMLSHLLEMFSHSVVLQNVMRSITYRGSTLIQTAGLALVMIYLFGVVGFILFPELFQFAEADIDGGRKLEPNNNGARCTSVWKCSLIVLDMGLRKGDLGEAMDDIGWDSGNGQPSARIFYRMIYTLLFFILVSTILMNIIFGVIIDTFAELRARKDEIDKDISGRCFICGIDRFVFDQMGESGKGFKEHITDDHNMWKYLYFQVYLREKDYNDYSGGESYVFQKTLELVRDPKTHELLKDVDSDNKHELKRPIRRMDILWFPQKAAMRLKNQKASLEVELKQKMNAVGSKILSCADSLNHTMDKIIEAGASLEASRAVKSPGRGASSSGLGSDIPSSRGGGLQRERSLGVHV